MSDFIKRLYQRFEGNPHFDEYFWSIDPDQDGNYTVFGAFGELVQDLLTGKIDDNKLLIELCQFIDFVIDSNDNEWVNVVKSEIFSILNSAELIKLQSFLSKESNKELNTFL